MEGLKPRSGKIAATEDEGVSLSSSSQLASSQSSSAARASLRRLKGPRTGPLTGLRSATQRPWDPARHGWLD